jgi:hypothetical protein
MSEQKDLNRIQAVDPLYVTCKTRRLLGQVRAKRGLVPNLFRVLANVRMAARAGHRRKWGECI